MTLKSFIIYVFVMLCACWLPLVHASDVPTGVTSIKQVRCGTSLAALTSLANSGDLASQFCLGDAYQLGKVGAPNPAVAQSWYRAAALKGYAPAELRLGQSLVGRGWNSPQANVEAFEWIKKAAEQGLIELKFYWALFISPAGQG